MSTIQVSERPCEPPGPVQRFLHIGISKDYEDGITRNKTTTHFESDNAKPMKQLSVVSDSCKEDI